MDPAPPGHPVMVTLASWVGREPNLEVIGDLNTPTGNGKKAPVLLFVGYMSGMNS